MSEVEQNLIPGTVVRFRSKQYGYLVHHWGVVDWPNWFSGQQAIHCAKDSVVKTSTLAEFSEGEELEVVWVPQTRRQQVTVLNRMHSLEGQPYDLFRWNCEHVVTWAVTGKAVSGQLRFAGVMAGLVAAIFLLGGFSSGA